MVYFLQSRNKIALKIFNFKFDIGLLKKFQRFESKLK